MIIKMALAVDGSKLADVVGALQSVGQTFTIAASTSNGVVAADFADDEPEVPTSKRSTRTAVQPVKVRGIGGNRGPVVYTPVGTQKQIEKTLASLRKGTLTAYVLTDIVKHPETSKRDMLARLVKPLAKAGLSLESVDNVVWNFQKKGIVKSVPVTE